MFRGRKVIVVMPAYNAAQTLRRTYDEVMAQDSVDLVIIVDDGSQDETAVIAKSLPNVSVYIHSNNRGYGANQKTCYRLALEKEGMGREKLIDLTPSSRKKQKNQNANAL